MSIPVLNQSMSRRRMVQLAARSAVLPALAGAGSVRAADPEPETDVLVLGGGLAGLTAASELVRAGRRVTVVEKRAWLGGDALMSTGTIFGAGTFLHEKAGMREGVTVEDYWKRLNLGIDDEPLSKVRDNLPVSIIYSGIAKHDPKVLRACVELSPEVVRFAAENGVSFLPVNPLRPFLLSTERGSMSRLAATLRDRITAGGGQILTRTRALDLLEAAGRITGARVVSAAPGSAPREIRAGRTIVATGGFLDNAELMRRYKRTWAEAPRGFSAVGEGVPNDHTGDGILMARRAGAALEDMESVPKFYAATAEKGVPGFTWMLFDLETAYLLDRSGRRFINEHAARYSGCSLKMFHERIDGGWVLLDEAAFTGPAARAMGFGKILENGGFFKSEDLGELARMAGIDAAGLAATVERINRDAAAGADSAFGRKDRFFRALKGPFYLSRPYLPVIFKTEGGIEVNDRFEALRHTDGEAIPGLLAVGAACGSISTRLCDVIASGLAAARGISRA